MIALRSSHPARDKLEKYKDTVYDSSDMCIGLPLTQIRKGGPHTFEDGADIPNETTEPGMYYSVALFLGLNLVCFLIVLGCYIEIIRAVKSTSREAQRSQHMREQLRITLKVTAIIATDFCCWFPIIIIGILGQSGVINISATGYAMITTFVLPINSTINPFLYTLAHMLSAHLQKRRDHRNARRANHPLLFY